MREGTLSFWQSFLVFFFSFHSFCTRLSFSLVPSTKERDWNKLQTKDLCKYIEADITQKKLLSYTDKVRKDNFLYVICLAQCERDQNVRRVLTQERALIYQFAKTIDTIFREGG